MIDSICYGCMSDKGIADVCPYCQFDERSYEQPKYALPLGYVLANRYVIGKVLGSGGFGITYLAYDKTLKVSMAIKEYLPKSLAMRDGRRLAWSLIPMIRKSNLPIICPCLLRKQGLLHNSIMNLVLSPFKMLLNPTAQFILSCIM